MSTLALFGGKPIREKPFPAARTTGQEEVDAVKRVAESGLFSGFAQSMSDDFYGGPMVRTVESAWAERFQVNHALACNSATSGLIMAVGAVGVGPGDEVIVSPYTMSATAASILIYGGIPVFADIEPDCYCIDPASIRKRITPRTKAIIAVDIHGQSSDVAAISQIAREHNLKVIYDCAQAPGALYHGKPAGTLGDIGVYSLNRHKNIQCGEGGIAVTRDDELCLRMQLIRNHGEGLLGPGKFQPKSLANMVGFNFRMTEMEAAVAYEQFKKLDLLNNHRITLANALNERLAGCPALDAPVVREGCTHVYYMHVMLYAGQGSGIHRDRFVEALRAEGIPIWGGYMKPLYLEPLYQNRIAIGDKGFPFVGPHYQGEVDYSPGICPVAEDYFKNRSVVNPFLYPPLTERDMTDMADAIDKVWSQRHLL